MIKHYTTSIYRNFQRDKVSTTINLSGLIIGFTTFILLSIVINYELNYDTYNINYNRIYRIQTKQEDSYPTNYCAYSPVAFRYHLAANLPEVEQSLIMREASAQYFSLPGGEQLYDKNGYWSENSIFDIFTIKLLEGNKTNALTAPNTIAISETFAKKLSICGNAVGKQVLIGKQNLVTVSAVYADFPENSSIRPSYLLSMCTFEALASRKGFRDNWTFIDNLNYVLLKEGTDPQKVDAKIKNAFKNVKNFEKSTPYLHPISKHHTSPNSQSDFYIMLSILSFAAFLVLLLSCINYVNLSVANSTQRAREIGIKKVVGSSRYTIAMQFLLETIIFVLLAAIIGLFIAQGSYSVLNTILGKKIDYSVFENKQLLLIILTVSIFAGILSGIYPALVLSSYNPVKILKNKIYASNTRLFSIKKILIVVQFFISLFILIVSFMIYNQVNFILGKNLGFDSNHIMFAEMNTSEKKSFETIKNRLLQHPEIVNASFSSTIPFMGNIGGYISWEGARPDEKVMVSRNYVSYDFIPTYDIKMLSGRNFSMDFSSDYKSCIINETALKSFGWTSPIGKQIFLYGNPYDVIGVVKDFHPFSIHSAIPVYVMFLQPDTLKGTQLLTVRFTPGNEKKAKQLVNQELEAIYPNDPFEFNNFKINFMLDGAVVFWQSLKKIFFLFAVITLLISSIGLFGLMLFTTARRTKEIGVRKILGSSISNIYKQLSFEIIELLAIAILFACPAAWVTYRLMPGAYKEMLTVFEFIVPICIIMFTAFLTISYHILKVAVSNPIKSLRYE